MEIEMSREINYARQLKAWKVCVTDSGVIEG